MHSRVECDVERGGNEARASVVDDYIHLYWNNFSFQIQL